MKKMFAVIFALFGLTAQAQVLPLNGTLPVLFTTYDPTSGALANADSTPTCTAYAPGSSSAVYSANAVNMSTGKYRWSAVLSVANGFAVGSAYRIQCDATVSSLAGAIDKGTVYVVVAEATSGVPGVNTLRLNNTSQTARDIGASVLVGDKTGFSLTSAYDPAKTASQAGDVMKVSSGTGSNQISLSSGAVTVASLAANSVTASALATDAVTEIQTGLYTYRKNVAGQKFAIILYDSSTGNPKSGALALTCAISKDFASFAPANDTSPAEVGHGLYYLNATQAETAANSVFVFCTATGARDFSSLMTPQH